MAATYGARSGVSVSVQFYLPALLWLKCFIPAD